MFCGHCGQKTQDGALFCPECGMKVDATPAPAPAAPVISPAPVVPPVGDAEPGDRSATAFFGAALSGDRQPVDNGAADAFFGAPPTDGPIPPVGGVPAAPPESAPILSGRFRPQVQTPDGSATATATATVPIIGGSKSRLGLLIGAGVAAVILIFLIIGAVRLIGGMGGGKQPIFYITDDTLMYLPKVDAKPIAIAQDTEYAAIVASENGKYAYFIDNQSNLYRAELGKLRAGAYQNAEFIVKVDSNIDANANSAIGNVSTFDAAAQYSNFYMTKDGGTVYYLKQDDGQRLRVFNGKDTETLEKDVNWFHISSNEKFLLVMKSSSDGTALVRRAVAPDGSSEILARDVSQLAHYNEDFTEIFYTAARQTDNGADSYTLYVTDKNGSEKLISDVAYVMNIESRTKFTYVRSASVEQPLMDFVEDDMAAQDAQITEPSYEQFRMPEQYVDYSGATQQRMVTDYDKYYAARDLYNEKRNRDYLRENLSEQTYHSNAQAIYARDGDKDILLCDRVVSDSMHDNSSLYVYARYEDEDAVKLKLSTLDSADAVYRALEQGNAVTTACADSSGELKIFDSRLAGIAITADGTLYGMESEDNTLVRYTKNAGYSDRKQLAQDIQSMYLSGDQIFFTVSVGSGSFDLLKLKGDEKVKIASDLQSQGIEVYEDGAIAVLGQPQSRGGAEEMTYYTPAGEKRTYGSDVLGTCRLGGNDFLVLEDFSGNYGTLYLYGGKERKKIAQDITGFYCHGAEHGILNIY